MPSGGVVLVEVRPGGPPPSPLRQGAQAVTVYAGGQSACAVSVLHWPFNVKDPTLANAQSINAFYGLIRPLKALYGFQGPYRVLDGLKRLLSVL